MDTLSRFITPGILFLLTLVFGVWLSRTGKPYNGILFNVHKLIALGMVIVTAIQLHQTFDHTEIQAVLIGSIVISGLCVVALFLSGALMSAKQADNKILKTIHNLTPFLLAISLAATVYLLSGREA
jgi:hypothetical protein